MPYQTERRVEFRDTDAAGIAHFSVFMTWMEEVEHEALRSLGLSVLPQGAESVSWPRVKAECEYLRPARFEELLSISLVAERIGAKSVTYRVDFATTEPVATGRLTAVCCRKNDAGIWTSTAIPQSYLRQLEQLLET